MGLLSVLDHATPAAFTRIRTACVQWVELRKVCLVSAARSDDKETVITYRWSGGSGGCSGAASCGTPAGGAVREDISSAHHQRWVTCAY